MTISTFPNPGSILRQPPIPCLPEPHGAGSQVLTPGTYGLQEWLLRKAHNAIAHM